jgi:hypothetical protein
MIQLLTQNVKDKDISRKRNRREEKAASGFIAKMGSRAR